MLNTVWQQARGLTRDQRNSFVAALLGWTMDAFDYFLVVLVYAEIAKEFGVSLTEMAFLTTVDADHAPGRRGRSSACGPTGRGRRTRCWSTCCFYSVVGFVCAFAPNFTVLLVLRLLYGIGMGGEWGLGAALAMEKIPAEKRGFFSGVLQQGYSLGYLLAALAFLASSSRPVRLARAVRASIMPGAGRAVHPERVAESEAWEETREQMRRPAPVPRSPPQPGRAAPLRLPHPADDRVQLDEPRHAGHLPDVPQEGPRASRRPPPSGSPSLYNVGAMIGGPLSARCPSGSGGGGRS